MKKQFLLFSLLFIFCLSCKKESFDDQVTFKETIFKFSDELELNFPSIIGLNIPIVLPGVAVTLNFPQEIEYTDPLITAVRDIKLNSISIDLIEPPGEDFSFLKHLTIYITAPGLPDIEFAHLYNIPASPGISLSLIPSGNVLDNYVKRNDYKMKVEATADKFILQDVKVNASLVLEVTLINEK